MSGNGDYISREAAIEAMYKDAEAYPEHTFWVTQHEALLDVPAADVRPVVRKPVVGYEGLYFVTNDGEVTNADGVVMKQHAKKGRGTCYKNY